jgi:hypothetical protein
MGKNMEKGRYLKLARCFLEEARKQLDDYAKTGSELALRQACEKGWGAVAQALMAAVGKPVESHKDFGVVASELFKKTGNRSILTGESAGEYLHSAGFYHGLPTAELVSNSLDLIEELLKTIERF